MRVTTRGALRWLLLASSGAPLLLAAARVSAADEGPDTLRLHYTAADAQTGRYQHVPFEVPAGTTRLEIEYRYDRADGANVLDLGLLEPGPLELGVAAFRGWSGGERSQISVGLADATPGYWPGPLPVGRWHVQLGLYKVAEAGVDVELTISLSHMPAAPAPALRARPPEPLRRGAAWYSGALHTHTLHSDGRLSPRELAERAGDEGLDFLAITDHNNTAHQREELGVPELLHIVGEEVTTPGGHASVWGLGGERALVDFRVAAGDPAIRTLVDEARARGALFSINHPFDDCFACSWTHGIPDGVHALEVSNPRGANLEKALALWDSLLRQGRRLTAVGSSDWHRGDAPLGRASVRVWSEELSTRAILAAIREGRVVVMGDARTPPPELRLRSGEQQARIGETLRLPPGAPIEIEVTAGAPWDTGGHLELLWRGERVASRPVAGRAPVRFTRHAVASGYYRIHLHASDGTLFALTNPVFLEVGRQ